MAETTSSVKRVLADFSTPIIPNIVGDPMIEVLIELHCLISINMASVASNLRGGRNGHLALTMTAEYYMAQTGYEFVPPHNPVNYPPTMGNVQ